jgi:hypothetical protein
MKAVRASQKFTEPLGARGQKGDTALTQVGFVHSSLDIDEKLYNFSAWASMRGVVLEKAIGWEDYPQMGYGLQAATSI